MFKGLLSRLKKVEQEPDFVVRIKNENGKRVVTSVYNRKKHEAWSDETIASCGLSELSDKFD